MPSSQFEAARDHEREANRNEQVHDQRVPFVFPDVAKKPIVERSDSLAHFCRLAAKKTPIAMPIIKPRAKETNNNAASSIGIGTIIFRFSQPPEVVVTNNQAAKG